MSLNKIIIDGLKQNGFDGLVNPGVCGCLISELSPADCVCSDCQGGYAHYHSVNPEFWIVSTQKKAVSDAEIEQTIVFS